MSWATLWTPWTIACQVPLSSTISQSLLKFMSIELVMLSNHLIPYSFCLQSFPGLGSFPMRQLFTSDGQSIAASASATRINDYFIQTQVFLVAKMVKNLPVIQESLVDPWAGMIPWRREWQPTLVFLLGESHGQRSLVGYSPWVTKSQIRLNN